MASIDVAKLLNKITQDIPGINTVLKALAKWDVSALTDVPDGAMQATTDANNNLTIKKKVSGSYTPVAKLMHDVDKLDGYHASASATANTVAVRNASGALPGNILGNSATADTATALATGSVVPVNQGGTGATTASQARANLGVADGADFTTHIAKQASPSVEGHVKLNALAADGSSTAAPGGFGLGTPLSTATDYNNCVVNGWYYGTSSTANAPPNAANYHVFVQALSTTNVLQKAYRFSGSEYYTRVCLSGVWSAWVLKPIGITDSTSTTSSTIAASATAVKAAYDRAQQIATASISGGVKVGGAIGSVSADGTVTLRQATTAQRGDVLLSSSVASSSAVTAATSLSVKTAYDKAVESAGFTGDIFASLATSRTGCLLMNGAAVSRTTYAGLFSIIGTTFGTGDGSTTFNLPNASGRVLQGANGNLMALLEAALPNATGNIGNIWDAQNATGVFARGNNINNLSAGSGGIQYGPVNIDLSRASSVYKNGFNSVQNPAIAVNYFIMY